MYIRPKSPSISPQQFAFQKICHPSHHPQHRSGQPKSSEQRNGQELLPQLGGRNTCHPSPHQRHQEQLLCLSGNLLGKRETQQVHWSQRSGDHNTGHQSHRRQHPRQLQLKSGILLRMGAQYGRKLGHQFQRWGGRSTCHQSHHQQHPVLLRQRIDTCEPRKSRLEQMSPQLGGRNTCHRSRHQQHQVRLQQRIDTCEHRCRLEQMSPQLGGHSTCHRSHRQQHPKRWRRRNGMTFAQENNVQRTQTAHPNNMGFGTCGLHQRCDGQSIFHQSRRRQRPKRARRS
mmetsp:Transcript_107172/g.181020  ORF Transcript_107172/g.181020 Transcript_107172/m.181020 type:complete len:285 (-) Transcript_107172:316-1170(-)